MKGVNLALVTLAGLGLVASDIAYADTLPAAALPSVTHAHVAKVARLTDKRHADASGVFGLSTTAVVIGAVALGGLVFAIVEATNGNKTYVSSGS